ncbi:hypothetical protein P853_01270 [Enterobacter hormaechei subsp. hoffmannii UCI 50]|uniref:DUF551 domain-containing protein n=1 Tax=Enterobacter hormaechei TaxID=158836 RepID=UPI00044CC275|nr:DUF551 domain-containing protein [Enterobacter hormaechei]EUL38025.1 hypothetical protein P853_01270 [Enterobacter hormaechei subsp. hoffmannii UCI 50]
MSTTLKEWLLKTIAELEEERDATPGAVNEDAAKALAAMKIALGALEAEHAGFIVKHKVTGKFGSWLHSKADWFRSDEYEVLSAYTAPPAPVSVPDAISTRQAIAKMENHEPCDSINVAYKFGWNACRAAMLKHSEPFIVTSDHRMMEMPQVEAINAVTAMLQGADGTLTNEGTIPVTQFKPVADLYGLTSPAGSETSFTFDAVEARDFIDGGWSCQEYVELGRFQEAMLQNGNSPAQSDCCPEQNYIAPAQDGDSPVIPDGWIPVSERMPGSQEWVIVFAKWDNQQVLCWDDVANRWTDFEDQSYYADMFTHWMPLPAAPQQEVESQIRKGKTVAREEWELGARLTKHRFKP